MKTSIGKRLGTSALAIVLCGSLVMMETACSSAQVENAVAQVEAQLPNLITLANNIATLSGNPEVAVVFGTVTTAIQADLPIFKAALAAYQADKSAGNFQAVIAALDSIINAVNPQLLAANKIASTPAQKTAVNALAVFSTALALSDGFLIAVQPAAAQAAHAATHTAKLREVLPLLDREQVARYDAAVQYEQAHGF
jgi:hypothetical protein